MPTSQPASLTPSVVIRLLREHAWVWIVPAVAGLLLAGFASLATPRKWKASQGLIVRSETAGFGGQRLGKFTDLSEMRTVQETILEVARSQSVLTAALQSVPEKTWFGRSKPITADDIQNLREDLAITPPGGAVFGATEVFYLTVLAKNSDRAVALCDAISTELAERMQELRNQQAVSMTVELENAATSARDVLQQHTVRLAAMESEVGADLADLRSLVSPLGGRGALAEKALSLEAEIRQSEASRRQSARLLATLEAAEENPSRLLATPSALLASQPALQRLKEGLIDARLKSASLEANRSERHPFVVAAKEAERRYREELHREVPAAIAGIELELSVSKQREAALKAELSQAHAKIGALAGRRAEYSSLVAAVENQTRLVDAAEAQLADARAHGAGVASASVLERVDAVEAGIRPVGPGRATVSLAGGLGGLILGLGLVFALFAPKTTPVESITSSASHPEPASQVTSPIEPTATDLPYGSHSVAHDVRPQGWAEVFPTRGADRASIVTADMWTEVTAAGARETVYAG